MMEYQEEFWDEFIEGVQEYLEEQFKEVGVHAEALTFDPDYELYKQGSLAGRCIFFTAKVDDKTVGYSVWWIGPHNYYRGHIIAISDLIYMDHEYRGKCMIDGEDSSVAAHFIRWCEEELYAKHGADMISIGMNVKKDFSRMLEQLGYEKTAIVCSKYLGS